MAKKKRPPAEQKLTDLSLTGILKALDANDFGEGAQEAESNAELEVKPGAKPRTQPSQGRETRSDGRSSGRLDSRSESNSGARPEGRSGSRSGTRQEAKPQGRSSSKPDDESGNQAGTRSGSRSQGRPENKPQPRSGARPESKPQSRSVARPESRSEGRPDNKPDSRLDGRFDARAEDRPEGQSESRTRTRSRSESISESKPEGRSEDRSGDRRRGKPEKNSSSAFDPNATVDYKQAGLPFPELPFAESDSILRSSQDSREKDTSNARQSEPEDRVTGSSSNQGSRKSQSASSSDASSRSSAIRVPKAEKKPQAGIKPPADSKPQGEDNLRGQVQAVSGYRPVNVVQSGYRIRGGGRQQGFMSHFYLVIAAGVLLLAVGAGVVYSVTNNLVDVLAVNRSGVEFSLTQSQTREAIDGRIPVLVNYVDYTIEETVHSLSEAGHHVLTNDRYMPDSLDTGAVTSELVSMPQEMSDNQMLGYYEGGFNAYSPEQLTQYFNGAFMLDLARGELGSWNKLRYVNLNAISIDDEMAHLATFQQLSGDTVTISAQGIDSRGNMVVQGQKVIEGDRVLFFKIAACHFKDVYNPKSLTEASIYITCTVATYDFFSGVDVITPA